MIRISRYKYYKLSLEELCELLYTESDSIQTLESMEEFVRHLVGKDNHFALFLLDSIYNSDNYFSTDFFIYNFCNGTTETPTKIYEKKQLLPYIEFKKKFVKRTF